MTFQDIPPLSYWITWRSEHANNPDAQRVFDAIQTCHNEQSKRLDLGDCNDLDIDFSQLPSCATEVILSGFPRNLDFSSAPSIVKILYEQVDQSEHGSLLHLKLPAGLRALTLVNIRRKLAMEPSGTLLNLKLDNCKFNPLPRLPSTLTELTITNGNADLSNQVLEDVRRLTMEGVDHVTQIPPNLWQCNISSDLQAVGLFNAKIIEKLSHTADLSVPGPTSPRAFQAILREYGLHHLTPEGTPSTAGFTLQSQKIYSNRGGLAGQFQNWISLGEPEFQITEEHEKALNQLPMEQQASLLSALQSIGQENAQHPLQARYDAAPFKTTLEIGRVCREVLNNPEWLPLFARLSLINRNILYIAKKAKSLLEYPETMKFVMGQSDSQLRNLDMRAILLWQGREQFKG